MEPQGEQTRNAPQPAIEIVQITSTNEDVYALCSDHTVWCYNDHFCEWVKLPPIPQETTP